MKTEHSRALAVTVGSAICRETVAWKDSFGFMRYDQCGRPAKYTAESWPSKKRVPVCGICARKKCNRNTVQPLLPNVKDEPRAQRR